MTADEIYELARKRQPAPDSLTLPELCLYTTARNIYKSYHDGIITLEQAKNEKQRSISGFERMNMRYEVYDDHVRRRVKISQLLTEADKNGCEICRRVSRVFDGREPVRDTSDKTHGVLVEVIRKAKQEHSQSHTDRTEDDYIAEAVMDAGFYERVEVQK